MLQEALEHLVRGLVTNPGDVSVTAKDGPRGLVRQVRTNPEDVGRVIGHSGRTATALRTVISALAKGDNVRVDIYDKH
jgi:predicted RNA-binding protein YlqC (UPF0109 family)